MKVYTGIDLVDIDRLHLAICRSGQNFLRRILSSREQQDYMVNPNDIYQIFGFKEAVIKAMEGMPEGGWYTDIEVVRLTNSLTLNPKGAVKRWFHSHTISEVIMKVVEHKPLITAIWMKGD